VEDLLMVVMVIVAPALVVYPSTPLWLDSWWSTGEEKRSFWVFGATVAGG